MNPGGRLCHGAATSSGCLPAEAAFSPPYSKPEESSGRLPPRLGRAQQAPDPSSVGIAVGA